MGKHLDYFGLFGRGKEIKSFIIIIPGSVVVPPAAVAVVVVVVVVGRSSSSSQLESESWLDRDDVVLVPVSQNFIFFVTDTPGK
jgi:hypothetical protein